MADEERHFRGRFLSMKGQALDDRITQFKLNRRHWFEEFNQPVAALAALGAGAAVGTTGAVNILVTPENVFEYHIKGAGQTIVAPVVTTTGLNIGMDQTDDEGVEVTGGILASTRMRGCIKAGTDPDWYVRAKIKIGDASGTDDLCVGFRKAEAYQAAVDNYDEGAWLGVGQGAAGRFNSETILNNGATTTTNLGLTAWADGETHDLEVRVLANRSVEMYVDGALVGSPAFSFDADEFLIPFIFFLHSADVADAVEVIEWEFGPLSMKQ